MLQIPAHLFASQRIKLAIGIGSELDGIIAIHQQQHVTAQYMFTAALRMLRQKGFIGEEDKIAYLSGSLGKGNGTTFLEINQVKEVFNKHYRFHLPDTGI